MRYDEINVRVFTGIFLHLFPRCVVFALLGV